MWHDIVYGAGRSSVQRQSPGQSDEEPYDDPSDEAYDNAFHQATHELHRNAHQNGSAIYGHSAPPKSKMASQFVGCRWSDTHHVEETLYDVRQTPQTRRQTDTRRVEETAYDVEHNSARIDTRVLPSGRRCIAHTQALVLDEIAVQTCDRTGSAQVGVGDAQVGVGDAQVGVFHAQLGVCDAYLGAMRDGNALIAVLGPLGKVQGAVQDYERVGAQLRDLDALIRKATQPDHTDRTSPHALPSSPSHTHTTHTHTHTQAPPYWSARAQGLAHIDSSVEDEAHRLLPASYRMLPAYPGSHGAGASTQASDIGEYKGSRSVAASAAAVSTSSTTSFDDKASPIVAAAFAAASAATRAAAAAAEGVKGLRANQVAIPVGMPSATLLGSGQVSFVVPCRSRSPDTGASASASLSRGPTLFVVPPPCTYDVNTAGPPSYWSPHAHGFALHDHYMTICTT